MAQYHLGAATWPAARESVGQAAKVWLMTLGERLEASGAGQASQRRRRRPELALRVAPPVLTIGRASGFRGARAPAERWPENKTLSFDGLERNPIGSPLDSGGANALLAVSVSFSFSFTFFFFVAIFSLSAVIGLPDFCVNLFLSLLAPSLRLLARRTLALAAGRRQAARL